QGKKARYKVVALLPGAYRPLLSKGMNLRLELSGYARSSQDLPIATVGDGVISPNEARRYLGAGIGGAVRLGGSVFVVEAPLPGATFTFEGNKHRYYDGMYGYGEVVVRSEPILVKLLPGLKGLWGNK
ncbi:MAG: hemolysin D, partial [Myxococcales bacterium]|nr:hemolysin D [Myxococcales bacterium]